MATDGLPKAELHLHLEGAIRPRTVIDLAREHELDFPFASPEELERALVYPDFLAFLKMFQTINPCLAKPRDFERISRELVEDLVGQGAVYAEIHYSPMQPMLRGMSFDDVTAAVLEGLRQGKEGRNIELALICGLTRQWDCNDCARRAGEWAGRGVDAVGLGGDEAGFPAELFVQLYRDASSAGLQVTAHAGEAAGPESVWNAVKLLGVRRIGHGIRSIEDPNLVEFLREEGVTLEVCPTSNVQTRVVPDYARHPLRRLYDAGVRVTVNSDDPAMFRSYLADEYDIARREFGFTEADLRQVTRNAVEAGFAPAPARQRILDALA